MPDLKFATFNICHGKGREGRFSLKDTAATLEQLGAHIIVIQEADRFLPRSRFQHQAKILARKLGMNFAFAPNIRFGRLSSFGNAIISKYSILKAGNLLLPGNKERRGLQHCLIYLPGRGKICILNTHLGLSPEEQKMQIETIVKVLSKTYYPVLLAGDFNCTPYSPAIKPLLSRIRYGGPLPPINTYPSEAPDKAIDQIYVSPHWEVSDIRTCPSTASDHLPLVCSLGLKVQGVKEGRRIPPWRQEKQEGISIY